MIHKLSGNPSSVSFFFLGKIILLAPGCFPFDMEYGYP